MTEPAPASRPLAETDFVWPISGVVTSPYGDQGSGFHDGIDIDGGDIGAPIYAVKGGTAYTKSDPGGYGNYVYITHGNGYATEYGHVNRFKISNGQSIKTGQLIAGMGSSGNSTGPCTSRSSTTGTGNRFRAIRGQLSRRNS